MSGGSGCRDSLLPSSSFLFPARRGRLGFQAAWAWLPLAQRWEWGWGGVSQEGGAMFRAHRAGKGVRLQLEPAGPLSPSAHLGGKGRATGVYNDIWAPGRTQQYISTLRFSSPFISTVPTTKGHRTIWVLPRADGVPRTWIFSFKSKTRQGKPERVAYPTPASPARYAPLWALSLHLLQSQQRVF